MNKFDFACVHLHLRYHDDSINAFLADVRKWRETKTPEATRELGTIVGRHYKAIGDEPEHALNTHLVAFSDEVPPALREAFKDGWWTGYRGE
jgi:hypothetical protein